MKMSFQVAGCRLQVAGRRTPRAPRLTPRATRLRHAFTLLELLVVISIIGILAALSVPAIKEIGQVNLQAGATQQMLDGVARARQLAISRHTTVYMVFVPQNFFNLPYRLSPGGGNQVPLFPNGINSIVLATNRAAAYTAVTNLIPLQMTGYNFLSYGKVGDQPGQHQWAYLSDWDSLPDGTFIPSAKFLPQNDININPLNIPQWWLDYAGRIDNLWQAPPNAYTSSRFIVKQICGFTRQWVPFPTENSPLVYLPCLMFDYRGQLVSEVDVNGGYHHAYIPLAHGSVSYGMDRDKHPQPTTVQSSDIVEKPPGNSTGLGYTVIDINPLTGRAELQQYQMK